MYLYRSQILYNITIKHIIYIFIYGRDDEAAIREINIIPSGIRTLVPTYIMCVHYNKDTQVKYYNVSYTSHE